MIIDCQLVDLEVQVNNEGDYPERVLLYWAKDFSSVLAAGQDYSMLPQTIVINLVDFRLFDCVEFHSFFQVLEVTRHTLLTDRMGLHFFELPKLPTKISDNNMLLLWLSLFKANTEEELEKRNDETTNNCLKEINVLVDGKFEIDKKVPNLRFKGSANQRILDVPECLAQNKIISWDK